MKNYLLIILIGVFVSFSENANAQYKSIFGKDSTSWSVYLTEIDQMGFDSLIVKGDTVVNSITYKKLYEASKLPNNYIYVFGLIREDTVLGKIYTLNLSDSIENVIADFSLQVGDYLIFPNRRGSTDTAFVDSVFYVNGLKQISFNYQNWWQTKFIMMEGIGTTFGVSYKLNSHVFFMVSLLCMQKDSERTFQNCYPSGACCFNIYTSLRDLKTNPQFQIFPNPSSQSFSIQLSNFEQFRNYQLIITDPFDKIVKKFSNADLTF